MAMVAKTLGGLTKAAIGIGGSAAKGVSKIFGDEAVEAVGKKVGELQKGVDDIVGKAVKQDEIYKAAKNKARGIKEASTKGSSDVVNEAISKNSKPVAPTTSYDYRNRVVDGTEVFERRPTGGNDSSWVSVDGAEYGQARRNSHSKTSEFSYTATETTGNLPAVIAEQNASGKLSETWDGLPDWAKYTGTAVAGGIAGAVLFGGDND